MVDVEDVKKDEVLVNQISVQALPSELIQVIFPSKNKKKRSAKNNTPPTSYSGYMPWVENGYKNCVKILKDEIKDEPGVSDYDFKSVK